MKAFPYQHKNPTSGLTTESEGMTLRDYIAIHAMQAFIGKIEPGKENESAMIPFAAYLMADKMLKEREA